MIGNALRERYVFPDVVPAILDNLETGHRAGRYDLDDPGVFAEVVGADMRGAADDKHLNLRFDPAGNATYASRADTTTVSTRSPAASRSGSITDSSSNASSTATSGIYGSPTSTGSPARPRPPTRPRCAG
ncbi:hypothetical protein L3i22_092750 [Actinoplanes sp. L3-i22]|nr:hypothetical protein L3i22_092750 [Actinoplanes sp. L3-i22]